MSFFDRADATQRLHSCPTRRSSDLILTDSEGFEYPEVTALDGWHVNIRLVGNKYRDKLEALDAVFGENPSSPMRVWAS